MVPIVQVRCDERRSQPRRWICRADSPSEVWGAVNSMQGMPNFIGASSQNFPVLFDTLTDVYLIDDVGAILVCKQPVLFKPNTAHVHVTFWDKILKGREELCRRLANYVIKQEEYWYLWTVIPENAGAIRFFARRVGFQPILSRNGIEYMEFYPGSGA